MRLMFYLFIISLFCFTIFSYLFIDPNIIVLKNFYTGFATSNRILVAAIYILLIAAFHGCYLFFVYIAKKGRLDISKIKNLIILVVISLIFSYPAMLSYDIFNYITTAKVAFFYKENPYIVMPIEFISDVNLDFTRAANKIALYGPAWVTLTFIPFSLGFQDIVATVLAFKVFIALFYIATCWLIWRLTKNTYSLALFALNPLVMIEILVGAHNDVVMMFFALLAFYFVGKKQITMAFLSFFTSVMVKYATIVLFPVFLYATYQTIREMKLDWARIYMAAAILMFAVFLISPFREEIYPWYVIWILSFAILVPKQNFFLSLVVTLSFATLLRYLPVLYTGSYFGKSPLIKELLTFIPLALVSIFWIWKKQTLRII